MHTLFFVVASVSIVMLFMIMIFLFMEGIPIFDEVSVKDFIFGKYWYPTSEPPDFGILSLIVASLAVTLLSALISIPLGILTAIYIADATPMGIAIKMAPILRHKVPTIHGRMPPFVIESIGGCVKNVQFMALHPFAIIKYTIN